MNFLDIREQSELLCKNHLKNEIIFMNTFEVNFSDNKCWRWQN